MRNIKEIQEVIISDFERQFFYQRDSFPQLSLDNYVSGIVGPRGVGKTTFMLHLAIKHGVKQGQALYVTTDNVFFLEGSLFSLAETLYKETDTRLLCIDEIHRYPNWRQELKNIADTFRELRVVFTGSSMIDLVRGKYDLSRRVTLYPLHGLSFREYLEFYQKIQINKVAIDDIFKHHEQLVRDINIPNILKYFRQYLAAGYYLFFHQFSQDLEKYQALENIVQKTIYEDIATLHSLKTPTLMVIEKLYRFIIHSQPGEININKLANAVGKDHADVSGYLNYLQESGLIRFITANKSGKAALRSIKKMYPDNSNLIHSTHLVELNDMLVGKERETFFVSQLQNAGISIYYAAKGDFEVNQYTLEIGGQNKTQKQIKDIDNAFVVADGILIGSSRVIPLYLFGLLY